MNNKFDHRKQRYGAGQFDGGYGSSKRVDPYTTRGIGPWWIYAFLGVGVALAVIYMLPEVGA